MNYECAHCGGAPRCPAEREDEKAPYGRWVCTRNSGHKGPHVALNPQHEVKAVWNRTPSKAKPRSRRTARGTKEKTRG